MIEDVAESKASRHHNSTKNQLRFISSESCPQDLIIWA